MRSFEDVRSHLAARHELGVNEPYLLCFDLPVGDERRQSLFLAELETDTGRKVLRISTPVAPLAVTDAKRCLRFNWEQRAGFLAVSDLEGHPWLHLCENRPYDALDEAELDRLLAEIGALADGLERLFAGGADST